MPKVKSITQCKHPNSRKTNALIKQITKKKSREKSKSTTNLKLNVLGEKVAWFKEHTDSSYVNYTPDQCIDIIEKYLGRFDEELEQIKLKHSIGQRKNRQHASREDLINHTIKTENNEYNSCGIEMPDLLDPHQFDLLKNWKGELRFLQNFKFKRYSKSELIKKINKQ